MLESHFPTMVIDFCRICASLPRHLGGLVALALGLWSGCGGSRRSLPGFFPSGPAAGSVHPLSANRKSEASSVRREASSAGCLLVTLDESSWCSGPTKLAHGPRRCGRCGRGGMEAEERNLADPCGRKRRGDAASSRGRCSPERIFTDRHASPPPMRRRSRLGRAMQRMLWCLVLLLMMPGEGALSPAGIVEIPVAGGMEGGSSGPQLRQGGSSGAQLRQWRTCEVPKDFPTVLEALQLRLPGTQIKVPPLPRPVARLRSSGFLALPHFG
jgi:hypothetical protein